MIAELASASHSDPAHSRHAEDLSNCTFVDSLKMRLGAVVLGGLGGSAILSSCVSMNEQEQARIAIELASYEVKEEIREQNLQHFIELKDAVYRQVQETLSTRFPELFYQEQGRMVGELASALEARASIDAGSEQNWGSMVTKNRARSAEMISTMLNPTVRVNGEDTVGSGVIIFSEQDPSKENSETLVLTSWHVIRDIFSEDNEIRIAADGGVNSRPISVEIFRGSELEAVQVAHLLHHNVESDLALLSIKHNHSFSVAKLATAEQAASMRAFDPIFAVGCPLGSEPIPTFGIVSDPSHVIEGHKYLMVSAPTHIGNSGGAIFSGYDDGFRLVGLLRKIYTHGRPAEVVPHMGLASSMVEAQTFLAEAGYKVDIDGNLEKLASPEMTANYGNALTSIK